MSEGMMIMALLCVIFFVGGYLVSKVGAPTLSKLETVEENMHDALGVVEDGLHKRIEEFENALHARLDDLHELIDPAEAGCGCDDCCDCCKYIDGCVDACAPVKALVKVEAATPVPVEVPATEAPAPVAVPEAPVSTETLAIPLAVTPAYAVADAIKANILGTTTQQGTNIA